ncbi:Aldehyde dehydrogenase, dimeric NADP-preferring [Entophlyctis luteolus]|nr:Aldehyde dehydrogenase, dimeric NADP-preferring [Entophlyctis luteolus]
MTGASKPHTDIQSAVRALRGTFESGRTRDVAWRKRQLQSLHKFMTDHYDLLAAALQKDLNKSPAEALMEIMVTTNEAVTTLASLDEWVKPTPCTKTAATMNDEIAVRHEPLGVVLIIGPWNFPINLNIHPLISAIAAGNCVIVKPSEISTASEALLAEWLPKILDQDAIKVVTGGIPETTLLLEEKFDHIFFTGSVSTGRVVMQAAAKHLTPVTLELGGKCPVYVDKNVNIDLAANRLMWAKTINAGQVCLSPDYVLIHPEVKEKFIAACVKATRAMFTDQPETRSDYGRIITVAHARRLQKLLTRQLALPHSKLEYGGSIDVNQRFVAPAIISGVRLDDPLLEDENFGPFLPFVEVKNEDEAIKIINSRPRPLSLYVLSDKSAVANKIMNSTSSGSFNVNSFIFHLGVSDMPFGGIGNSGIGNYHGRDGFDS